MNHAEAMILSLVVEAKALEAELRSMNLHDESALARGGNCYAEKAYEPLVTRLHQIPGDIRDQAMML